jgi:hypothetical protein
MYAYGEKVVKRDGKVGNCGGCRRTTLHFISRAVPIHLSCLPANSLEKLRVNCGEHVL